MSLWFSLLFLATPATVDVAHAGQGDTDDSRGIDRRQTPLGKVQHIREPSLDNVDSVFAQVLYFDNSSLSICIVSNSCP